MPLPTKYFNKALDLKLLELVRDNPVLYNTKHNKYLDFDSREVIWQKIGDILGRPPLVCKSRWVNMRDMMRRKIRDRVRNPSVHSYKYKYEDAFAFMMPFFKETLSTPNNDEYSEFLDDNACEVEMPNEVFVNETLDYDPVRETKPFKKKQEESSREVSYQEHSFQELNTTDPLDVFLLTIGSTLKTFSPYYLNQAKSKIFQVVQEYELQQIMNKDDQAPGTSSTSQL